MCPGPPAATPRAWARGDGGCRQGSQSGTLALPGPSAHSRINPAQDRAGSGDRATETHSRGNCTVNPAGGIPNGPGEPLAPHLVLLSGASRVWGLRTWEGGGGVPGTHPRPMEQEGLCGELGVPLGRVRCTGTLAAWSPLPLCAQWGLAGGCLSCPFLSWKLSPSPASAPTGWGTGN